MEYGVWALTTLSEGRVWTGFEVLYGVCGWITQGGLMSWLIDGLLLRRLVA